MSRSVEFVQCSKLAEKGSMMSNFRYAAVRAAALGAMVAVSGCAGLTNASAGADAPYQVAGPAVKQSSTPVNSYLACNGGVSGFVYSCDGFPRNEFP